MKSIDYIVTAKHYSKAEGADGTVRGRILKLCEKFRKEKGVKLEAKGIDSPSGDAVYARIWQGQWIADCPCNGAQFVDANEPIFFCFSCGNRSNDGRVRPVVFPGETERVEIERLLLERPVDDQAGLTDLERVGMAKPLISVQVEKEGGAVDVLKLGRDWVPGESVEDIREQNAPVKTWKREHLKGGK